MSTGVSLVKIRAGGTYICSVLITISKQIVVQSALPSGGSLSVD